MEATPQERTGQGTGEGELRMTVLTVRLATLALWPMRGPDMLWTRDLGGGENWGGKLGVAGSMVGESWLGVCRSLIATSGPFLHARKFHRSQSRL